MIFLHHPMREKEREGESNIAYDSYSDTYNNNNKNKRQIEQRRRIMTVNGSYPLWFKYQFLRISIIFALV